MYVNGDFGMNMGGWMEIIEISIISGASLMTLTRLMLVWLRYDLFDQTFDKIYQLVTCNSYNTSMIEPISMDSPPNDKWGLLVFDRWVCRRYRLYSTICLANEGFWYCMVGILIYRVLHLSLRCDSWYASYVINLVKLYKVHVLTIHRLLYI